jgi:predicted O-methyltransferase YrrM
MAAGVFNYADGFFGPEQIWDEIIVALNEIRALRPRCIIEIGTNGGGTLLMWSRVAHPEATIISIDLRGGQEGSRISRLRSPFFRRMGLPRQKIHLISGDSHLPATLEIAKKHLRNESVDFLFIDGDHSDAGVRTDYEMYGPLVREGGIVGFHDIALDTPQHQVHRLWRELTHSGRTRTIIGKSARCGIGLVYR